MEKVLTYDDYDMINEQPLEAFDNFELDGKDFEHDNYAREYVDELIKELSIDFPAQESSAELEDTAEKSRIERVRDAIGASATSMVTRFKESSQERQARREERRVEKEAQRARKEEARERREALPTRTKIIRKIGATALVGGALIAAAVSADKLTPDQYLDMAQNFMMNNFPGYDVASEIASRAGDSGSEAISSTPGYAHEVEILDQATEIEYDPAVRTIIVGGAGDPTGEGARAALGGVFGETVQYSASIAPAGPETMRESIDQAIPQLNRIFNEAENNPAEHYDVNGYSLGSVTVAEAANHYTDNGGEINGNVDMNLYGSPLVENTGAFSGGTAETITEVLDEVDIVYDTPLPENADTHSFKTDFWSNAGNAPVTSQASMLAGFTAEGHNVPIEGQNAVLTGETEMSNGGTSYSYEHMEGEQHPAIRAAEQHLGYDAQAQPELTEFVETIAPIGEVGSPDIPQIDTYDAINTGAAAIDESWDYYEVPAPPVQAEQFVADVGVENIAPYVEPVVDYLNQPADLSVLNTPEVAQVIEQVQDVSATYLPENFDPMQIQADVTAQVENFGFEVPQW